MNKRFKIWPKILSVIVLVIASSVLLGWMFGMEFLRRPFPDTVAMNPATAMAFIFSGIAFILLTSKNISYKKKITGKLLAVVVYDDRVLISNPGGLVSSISRNEFGTKSLSRNPLIFGLMQRINLVEKVGSGINRMKDAMKEAGLPAPVFNMDGFFTVTFYRPVDFEKWITTWTPFLNSSQVKILQMLHSNSKMTKQTLSREVGIGKTAIVY